MENQMRLENDSICVMIKQETGTFSVQDKRSGTSWGADPWNTCAAALCFGTTDAYLQTIDMSKSETIAINCTKNKAVISFSNPRDEKGKVLEGIKLVTEISLANQSADVDFRIVEFHCPDDLGVIRIEYPVRACSLVTEKERGIAAIPFIQGIAVPSYMYPMRNSKFGIFDDEMHMQGATGLMEVYDEAGLSMPWYGMQAESGSVVTFLPNNSSVGMRYYFNYNDRDYFANHVNTESPYERILSLYPSWKVDKLQENQKVTMRFIESSSYVAMAKEYRKEVIKQDKFISLEEKAKKIPTVKNLAGDIYLHLYGGYPHYINFKGMSFTFAQLIEVLKDLHDTLQVKKAFITVWGGFQNYPPIHMPINEDAGGVEELQEAFRIAKSFGYHITPYHSWCAMLEHDPLYDPKKLAYREDGSAILKDRWGTVKEELWEKLAMQILPGEIELLGSNASYSDALQSNELRKYLESLRVPLTQERKGDSELSIKEFHRLEGMAPHSLKSPTFPVVEIPLFNLVYHDAVITSNRWQSPDNDYDLNGDYAVRCLRNMLYGNEVMYVVPYYEYKGIRSMILQAKELMAPLHEETAFSEMVSHSIVSDDYLLQKSVFANGTEVIVNMSLVSQKIEDGKEIPGYGFDIKHSNGTITEGSFQVTIKYERKE